MYILDSLERINKTFLVFITFLLIGIIGFIDYITGSELTLSVFYVIPISLVIWGVNKWYGYLASIASVGIWIFADSRTGFSFINPFFMIWNNVIWFLFFIIFTFLQSELKSSLNREKELSHTDYLTSAANSRRFYEILQMEIDRFDRYQRPFTLAYLDIDNFKTVNDQFGHNTGDLVLQTIVNSIQKKTRKSDLVARLGGDEFALFFPETDQETAQILFEKINHALTNEIRRHNWSITYSMGVVTCKVAPETKEDLVKIVDELMYSAKADGKNTVKYSTYVG